MVYHLLCTQILEVRLGDFIFAYTKDVNKLNMCSAEDLHKNDNFQLGISILFIYSTNPSKLLLFKGGGHGKFSRGGGTFLLGSKYFV